MDIQSQAYQRQILAMMGVTPWVGRDTLTMRIDESPVQERSSAVESVGDAQATSPSVPAKSSANATINNTIAIASPVTAPSAKIVSTANVVSTDAVIEPESDNLDNLDNHDNRDNAIKGPNRTLNIKARASSGQAPVQTNDAGLSDDNESFADFNDESDENDERDEQVPVSPFTLQGIGYNNWVLLVDLAKLNQHSQKLWQNLHDGLSVVPDQLGFPFCQSMSTLDMANASLAGFVFKLGQSELVKVSALTELPEGLDHERMVRTPLLDEMIAEPKLKRQLWQLLSQS